MTETTRQEGGGPQKHTDSSTDTSTLRDVVDEHLYDDPLWSTLTKTANQTLYDPPNHGPLNEEIGAHIETAAEALLAAAELREMSITATLVQDCGHEYRDTESVAEADTDALVAALEARGYDVVEPSNPAKAEPAHQPDARTDGG